MIKIDLAPSSRILAQFAWVAVPGLPLVAAAGLRLAGAFAWDHPVLLSVAGLGVLQLLTALLGWLSPTRWIYVGLTLLAIPIGLVVSNLLVAVTYYLVLTPIALVFRLLGRDVLGKRPDPGKVSYWHQRAAERSAASYFKLY